MQQVVHDPAEVGQLRHRKAELVRHYEKLSERVALFENPTSRRQLEETALEISRLQLRLAELGLV
jgi:hypothetical protein